MKLSPTEEATLKRKAILTIKLSRDTKPDALRRDLASFNQEVIRIVTGKRLKHVKVVVVETDEEKS